MAWHSYYKTAAYTKLSSRNVNLDDYIIVSLYFDENVVVSLRC